MSYDACQTPRLGGANPMARTPQDVTDTELELLRRLWDAGSATIRRLTDDLYPGGGTSHYATVQKLLERLEAKGCVRRNRSASVHVFQAVVEREALIGRRLRAIAETLCDGSIAPLLTHLVRSQPLSKADRQSLKRLIDELDPSPGSQNRK
jgi:predicted transcriptional regulator